MTAGTLVVAAGVSEADAVWQALSRKMDGIFKKMKVGRKRW